MKRESEVMVADPESEVVMEKVEVKAEVEAEAEALDLVPRVLRKVEVGVEVLDLVRVLRLFGLQKQTARRAGTEGEGDDGFREWGAVTEVRV